uniref:C2H2-type domain-containing protein n=1 Tax=Anopheles epiroticus TaxID=199890 RepID=A0A182P019_9DIPT
MCRLNRMIKCLYYTVPESFDTRELFGMRNKRVNSATAVEVCKVMAKPGTMGGSEIEQPPPPPEPAAQPLEPTKPPDIDAETNASAANAVEQWRNYQQAYSAYQQQCAAYQHYIQQTQYAQTVEQQQMIYSQYLEQHRHYQYQLQQYEQYKLGNGGGGVGGGGGGADAMMGYGVPVWPVDAMQASFSNMMPPEFQHPMKPSMGPVGGAGGPPNGPHSGRTRNRTNTRRGRDSKSKPNPNEKKNELHTKTIIYLNPDDEQLLPADLKQLFGEFHCNLCRTRMNSHISANIHYQSKAHEKKINQWLKEYCSETGTPMPVRQRPPLELAAETNAIGKSVFHCEACDLVLTSVQHANQHYTGKRHAMVVNGKKLPSGNGHYNAEGKWIRTTNIATEVTSATQPAATPTPAAKKRPLQATQNGTKATNGAKNPRLEPPPQLPQHLVPQALASETMTTSGVPVPPVQQQSAAIDAPVTPAVPNSIPTPQPIVTINVDSDEEMVDVSRPPPQPSVSVTPSSSAPETTLEQEIRKKEGLDCVDDTGTFCLICETSVTSRTEMLMHLKGAKHLKKARSMGVIVRTTPFNASDTILRSLSVPPGQTDWSLYRMPSGKFYCKTCNLIVADEKLFGQHWYGKKHKLKQRQEQRAEKLQQQQQQQTSSTGLPSVMLPATESSFVSDDHDVIPMGIEGATDLAKPAGVVQIAPASEMGALASVQKGPPRKGRRSFFKRGRFGKPRPAFQQALQQ